MEPGATVELTCAAEVAWALLADPALAPEWVAGVADAEVLARDAAGRAVRVRFTGMPSSGSMVYEVGYEYVEPMTVRWSTVGEVERRMVGEASVEALSPARCRVHYRLGTESGRRVPGWARDALAGDTSARAVDAFRRFVERRAAAR